MRTLFRDIRYGFRMLVKSPAFTLVTVLVLGLGITLLAGAVPARKDAGTDTTEALRYE